MQHLDDNDLILLALDELPGNQPAASHVAECAQCQLELHSWRLTVGTARDTDTQLGPEPAPPHVWDAIAAEIAMMSNGPAEMSDGFTSSTHQVHVLPQQPGVRDRDEQHGAFLPLQAPRHPDASVAPPASSGEPISLDSRRARWTMPLMAAAIGALISGLVVYFAVRGDSVPDTPDAGPQLEAVANLEPLQGGTGLGKAALVKSANGVSWLQVQVSDLPAIDGSYEVWLLGADGKMVSLGVLAAGEGNFALPQGIDPGSYPVVDISDEPADGNPAHSKNSVARGELT